MRGLTGGGDVAGGGIGGGVTGGGDVAGGGIGGGEEGWPAPPTCAPAQLPARAPERGRRLSHDAVWALGAQVLAGVLLGWVWLMIAPRPPARWTGLFWYAETDTGFSAAQDVWFALLTAVPGLAVGVLLAWRSGRPGPIRRAALWLAGSALGATACWLTGAALGAGLTAPAVIEAGQAAAAAPLTLTSMGLLALWPFAAAAAFTLPLAARAAFARTW